MQRFELALKAKDIVVIEVDVTFRISTKGQKTLLYRNLEYLTKRDNVNESTSWRCRYYQLLQCKERLLTHCTRL